jgi:hypothetical protein
LTGFFQDLHNLKKYKKILSILRNPVNPVYSH